MKALKHLLVVPLVLAFLISPAQDSKKAKAKLSPLPGTTRMLITGSAWFGYQGILNNTTDTDVTSNFNDYGFSPVFLWKLSDRLFFESEVEIGAGEFELEFAKLSYMVNDYITIGAGRMLTPFGAYGERWEPNFVEKFPNSPMETSTGSHLHRGAIMGVDVRGGLPLGSVKMNYVVFISNGPILDQSNGMVQYENLLEENNNNKELGGRIGILPFSNSSLEIGFSYKRGIAGNQGDSVYKDVAASAFAIDWNYVNDISAIKSTITFRGQYNSLSVDDAIYPVDESSKAAGTYTFDNKQTLYFAQLSLRPSLVGNKFFKNLELSFRLNGLTDPQDAAWGAKDKNGKGGTVTRTDLGLTYWLSWKTSLRTAYVSTAMPDDSNTNEFLVSFVYGL
ncbi:MAG: hypothetical protein GXO89_02175 [Chlorobi bacterium]|nr:hypothetical protein [Chlorobiota bacterium]